MDRRTPPLVGDVASWLEGAGVLAVAFATPTRLVLNTWTLEGPELDDARKSDLVDLVRRQPADLEKVSDWLCRSDSRAVYSGAYPILEVAQEEGIRLRRRRAGSG